MTFNLKRVDEGGIEGKKFSLSDFKGQGVNLIRSALIGTFVGVLPGVGGSAASILSYAQAKSFSKHPELMGTGVPEGLVASETSNNGLTGGALIPLLSLGIPGDSTTAVLISAFMFQGIQVGPLFIAQNPDTWNCILVGMLLANIIMFLLYVLSHQVDQQTCLYSQTAPLSGHHDDLHCRCLRYEKWPYL